MHAYYFTLNLISLHCIDHQDLEFIKMMTWEDVGK